MLASLAVLLTGVAAQNCLSPRAFEARVFYIDPVAQQGVRGRFAYDGVNQRRYIDEQRFNPANDGNQQFLHVYALWNAAGGPTMYSFNVNTSQCLRSPITFPFREYGVYPNATLRRQVTVGTTTLPQAGVNLNQYYDVVSNSQGIVTGIYESEFTVVGCVPYRHYFINMTQDARDFREDHFYSTTLGIRDPSIFNPPSQCLTEALDVDGKITPDPNTWSMAHLHIKTPTAPRVTKSAADPVPCISPPSWQAHSSFYDPITQLRIRHDITYDQPNTREYIYEIRTSPLSTDDDNYYQIYALWNSNPPRLFVYHINTTICTTAPLTTAFRPIGVNPNATFYRDLTVGTNGLQNGGVEVYTFVHPVNNAAGALATVSYNTVTVVGCIPVRSVYLNFTGGTPQQPFTFGERHVVNVVPHFPDNALFSPPAACRAAVQSSVPAPHDRSQWSQLYELHKANLRAQSKAQ